MAPLLCGCAHPNELTGTPPLAVEIPNTCERILKPVPLPKVTAKTDARGAFLADDAALITAHGEIESGRGCIADVRTRYAKPR